MKAVNPAPTHSCDNRKENQAQSLQSLIAAHSGYMHSEPEQCWFGLSPDVYEDDDLKQCQRKLCMYT